MTSLQFWFLLFSVGLCATACVLGWLATRIKPLPAKFDHWLRSITINNLVHINSTEIKASDQLAEVLQRRVRSAITNANSVDLTLGGTFPGTLVLSADDRFQPVTLPTSLQDPRYSDNAAAHFGRVSLEARKGDVAFNGVSAREIVVGPSFRGRLILMNSWVQKLSVATADTPYLPSIEIVDTCIGDLSFAHVSCQDLVVSGGYVNHLKCVPPTDAGPFRGTVTFSNSPSLRATKGFLRSDAQDYRNLSMHLMKLGNIVAAKQVQLFEKRMERPKETPTIHFVSFMYDVMSLYGNAPGRAILWLAVLMGYTAALFFVFNSAELTEPCASLVGWQVGLCGDRAEARALRAIVVAVDATLNPLSILTKSHVVTASNIVLHSYLFLVGLTAIALITQAGIGIRRRFVSQ